ncbi:hypothetical protein J7M07_05825 [bacterium]|nr:hypothetical protein [bacterium]
MALPIKASIITLVWLDEIIDIPYLFLGSESTPLNVKELLFESIIIAVFGVVMINITRILIDL